ncbi:1383_t:CDS:1, partial [Paraglomus occultum]
ILEYDFGEEIASSVNQKAYQEVQRQTPETAMTIVTTPTESLHIPSGLEKMNNPTTIALSMEEIDQIVNTIECNGRIIKYVVEQGEPWFCLGTEEENDWSEHLWRTGVLQIPGLTTQTTPTMMMMMTGVKSGPHFQMCYPILRLQRLPHQSTKPHSPSNRKRMPTE